MTKLTEAGAFRSFDVARSSKRRHLGASWPSPLESACRVGWSVSAIVDWKFLPVYLHLYAREGDRFPSMRAKISRPMMGKNCVTYILSHVHSSYSLSCTHLESMPAPSSRQDQSRNLWMPIDQPMPISAIRVKAKPRGDKVLGRGETREEFGIFRTKVRDLSSRDREGRLMRIKAERGGDVVFAAGINVTLGVKRQLDDSRRVRREAVE